VYMCRCAYGCSFSFCGARLHRGNRRAAWSTRLKHKIDRTSDIDGSTRNRLSTKDPLNEVQKST
jgi:hypothetical protein